MRSRLLILLPCLVFPSLGYFLPDAPASDVGLDPLQLIKNHGYKGESHLVTTQDGYKLTMHRILNELSNSTAKKIPVFLMHGLVSSSADFVNMGPDKSLGFLLADAGYDVWMGNARGNSFSRKHTRLDPERVEDKKEYFNFSWHEIGYYDLPAKIDYILKNTGAEKLDYVGHSQGCTSFLVLTSTRPEYNKKINGASLMAPAAIMEHHPDDIIRELSKYISLVEKILLVNWNIFEIPFLKEIRTWAMKTCGLNENTTDMCIILFSILGGSADIDEIDSTKLTVIATNAPADSSIKQFLHYGQLIKSGGFSYYDYGEKDNLKSYGTPKPPAYDLTKITTSVAIYYGKNDILVEVEDTKTLISKLPNVAQDYLISYDKFNHLDFLFAKDVVALVYTQLMKDIESRSNNSQNNLNVPKYLICFILFVFYCNKL